MLLFATLVSNSKLSINDLLDLLQPLQVSE
jgi:hypothetical protein